MHVDDREPMQDVTLDELKNTNSERHTLHMRVVRAGVGRGNKGYAAGHRRKGGASRRKSGAEKKLLPRS